MLKKVVKVMFVFITLFYLNFSSVLAYDYVNTENAGKVDPKVKEVFDTRDMYKDIVGDYTEEHEIPYTYMTSTNYWWPIGSADVVTNNGKTYATGNPETTTVTSLFGYRSDPFGSGATTYHSGLDIAGGRGLGNVNIIAAREGVVVTTNDTCTSGTGLDPCGGGYGNYIILQHSDGNYTLYAHLYEHSVTVKSGDAVEQGQVIGKMGSSGQSTGAHLHFEVREGANQHSSTVDPLNYISAETPRTLSTSSEFLEFLKSWEGAGIKSGNNYIVQNIGDGVRTVGSGVTLENNVALFKKYGINIDDYPTGSEIPIDIVDKIKMEIVANKKSDIQSTLAANSITLRETQVEALVSRYYNVGNISGFVDNYKQYGDTEQFYNNWFFQYIGRGTEFEAGLTRRRNAEWSLFHNGIYVYN